MNEDTRRIAAYYDDLARRYGTAPQAVDASSQEALDVRYRVLGDAIDLSGKSVLEVGCGFGGLGAYLRGRFRDVDYTGIDVSEELVAAGRREHPELRLDVSDLLDLEAEPRYDAVVAQGVFYLLGSRAQAKAERLIEKMWALASECVAFTTLSAWATSPADAEEFRADPVRLLDYCRTLTTRLQLRHDYHPGDVAIYLYRA